MSLSSVFAVPLAAQYVPHAHHKTAAKRKRKGQDTDSELIHHDQILQDSPATHDRPLEYSAVVTPLERVQRRLAGLPLDRSPPPLPFPHARFHQEQDDLNTRRPTVHKVSNPSKARSKPSLHAQHLAAMTATLHRCMMNQDYVRAGRALGLLLRNEVGGHAIDIRREGLWGIGAEILFRPKDADINRNTSVTSRPPVVTREGFQRAKLLYERLMIQHPQHKTWPDAVNELDFCIAMFNLWVYFVNEESQRMQADDSTTDDDGLIAESLDVRLLEAKKWEYEQARQIAEAMEIRVRNAPFNGNREMIRLRAMVAFWTADLIDDCNELSDNDRRERRFSSYENDEDFLGQIERMVVDNPDTDGPQINGHAAVDQRSLAHTLLQRLEISTELGS